MNRLIASTLTAVVLFRATAGAQGPSVATREVAPLTTTFDAAFLRDLPTTNSVFAAVETLQPAVITDRFAEGGLYAGQPVRIGGTLGSWTQTAFRVDGVPITDPTGSGTPLLFPSLALFDRVGVTTGMMRADTNATGMVVDLDPIAPADRWSRTVEGALSHFGLTGSQPDGAVPAIVRLDGWDTVTAVARGPLVPGRIAAAFAASWARGSQFYRAERDPVQASLGSVFSHLVFTPNDRDSVRVLGWWQHDDHPFDLRTPFSQPTAQTSGASGHVQTVWDHRNGSEFPWRLFGSYTERRQGVEFAGTPQPVFERLVDGPLSALAAPLDTQVRQWSFGARVPRVMVTLGDHAHALELGAEATGARAAASAFFSGTADERVHGIPARVWSYTSPGTPSRHGGLTVGAFVSDRIELATRLTIEGALRFESQSASAEGAETGVSWQSLLPRVRAQWTFANRWNVTTFAGYARSADKLLLDYVSIGDPSAPHADVFSAGAAATSLAAVRGPLVARVGPGTGGDRSFSAIDPGLKPPIADEIVVGVESRPLPNVVLSLTAIASWERDLLGVANVGVSSATGYSSFTVQDPGVDPVSTADDLSVAVYNRLPGSFGLDRYLLTNTGQDAATYKAAQLSMRLNAGSFTFVGGATAGLAEGSATNRGFGPGENDQTVLGELLVDPNATTLARGRLFSDRAFTVKLAGVYKFPGGVTFGAIARYQDGQPFARLLVVPGLNQGADAVRIVANGDLRFTFIGSLDTRLQKQFSVGGRTLQAFVDAFNLVNLANSIEEDSAQAPDDRRGTALQPPRSFHLGVRLTF